MVNHPNRSKRAGTHKLAICEKDLTTGEHHVGVLSERGGGWTWQWVCPDCGRRGRFLANYIGSTMLLCDGVRFRKAGAR